MAIKLDAVERMEIIAELEMKTNFSFEYLKTMSDEKLIEELKRRG